MAALDVNGVRAPLVSDPGLAAGATTTVSFQAPPCPAGSNLVATVDVTALVDEHDEADNALTVPCPSRR
jgi:subtilase family serine protease